MFLYSRQRLAAKLPIDERRNLLHGELAAGSGVIAYVREHEAPSKALAAAQRQLGDVVGRQTEHIAG